MNTHSQPSFQQHNTVGQFSNFCTIVIDFPDEEQAKKLEKDMGTNAPDPSIYKKFNVNRHGKILSVRIHHIHDTHFSGGFLLAISASVKELVTETNAAAQLTFRFEGTDESGAALCMASHGLWPATFVFSTPEEKEKFNAARRAIHQQMKALTKEATPLLKVALAQVNKK